MLASRLASLGVLVLVACGGDTNPVDADGGRADGREVADAADARVGDASITVTRNGVPRMGVDVALNDPDGRLTASGTTDADGMFTRTVVEGGMVTVFGLHEHRTIVGIVPDDAIVYDLRVENDGVATVVVDLDDTPIAGALFYNVVIGSRLYSESFSDPTSTPSVTVRVGCVGDDDRVDVLAQAIGPGNSVLAFAAIKDVPLSALPIASAKFSG